jgi:hypothetical protein
VLRLTCAFYSWIAQWFNVLRVDERAGCQSGERQSNMSSAVQVQRSGPGRWLVRVIKCGLELG